ncbi:MAG: hypothetical protein K2Q34_06205 [Alphaproteobacteria bacterium]|nr:hypothetical protein [Alphaproteobacteria bacterium]
MKNILKFIGLLTCLSPLFMSGAKAMEFFNDTDKPTTITIYIPVGNYNSADDSDPIVGKNCIVNANGQVFSHWNVSLEPGEHKFDTTSISSGMKEDFLKSLQGFLSSKASLTIGTSFSYSDTIIDNKTRPLVASPSTLPGFVTYTISFTEKEEIDRALRSLVITATKSKGLTIAKKSIT